VKVFHGMQKLGNYKETSIFIDWDYLIKDRGLRKEKDDLQKLFGTFTRFMSLFVLIVLAIIDFLSGKFLLWEVFIVDRLIEVLFWVALLLFIYSFFLLRDRTKFFDTLDIKTLDMLRELENNKKLPEEIELLDYFDYDILNILDDLVRESDREFLSNLLERLIVLQKVRLLLSRLDLTIDKFEKIIHQTFITINTSQDTWLIRVMFDSFILAYTNGFEYVDEQVVFLLLCQIALKDILMNYKVMPNEVNGLLLWARNEAKKRRYNNLWKERAGLKPKNTVDRGYTSRLAVTLEKFKRDFTREVIEGDFVLSIARENELDEVVRLLKQGEKGAVLLIGDPGVGKTTLIKSLAVRMVVEDVPKELRDKRLVGFDFTRAYASSPNIDNFKIKLETILREVASTKNIILVLDDFDQLVNIRQNFAGEVINLIIEAMDKYKLRILATSTNNGYLAHIKPNIALVSLFDIVNLQEPNLEVAIQILIDLIPRIESKYRVKISFDAIRKVVQLSHKFAFDRVLPEKAIDLLTEAVVFVEEQGLNFVSELDIEKLVSKKVGVSLGTISDEESQKFTNIEEQMHKRVIGQNEAISAVADALRRSRAGISRENRPIASFLFFGPTGVGKTELAKTLAETYYGDEKLMIRLDMSEYQEDENLKRLIGYRQEDDFYGGYLTEAVRERPFSLVLLDELEKANPKVLDIFLQILDEGHVTDGIGRRVNFTNTIIIATSNVASKEIFELIKQGMDYKDVYTKVLPLIRVLFKVEFLNRFDKIIMFKPLVLPEIEQIAALMLETISKRLYEKGIFMDYSHEVLQELSHLGYNPSYGARELYRIVQENIENKIAELIVAKKLQAGRKLIINDINNFEISES